MASLTREPAPSFEELVRALTTRQLPLPRLLRALQIIGRSLKRDPSLATDLQRLGGVPSLLHYIEKPRASDHALSVLANCLIHVRVRTEVLESNGVSSLVRILTNIAEDSIRNRACRALANIALSARGAYAVHQTQGSVHAVVDFLNATKSKDSQATAMRALRVLGSTSAYRESITSFGGVAALARLILTVAEPLRKPCADALERLTHKCTLTAAKQVKDSGAFAVLVELSDSVDSALFTMVNIAQLDEMLVDVGSSGIIAKIVARLANNSDDSSHKLPENRK
ncbi:armadillo repeat-containing protein 5-like [Tropilaelaps mercedesae]|uniref:Armadillo repeat-containing protein 5-like n=1 Tax=Tropilaelaps mercedesae TaxID=418985 RepID=A0A1V9XT62_9ACAR|nr:armadillo repeat-containing protein 5-like [Tropilaelaps mercedesae]